MTKYTIPVANLERVFDYVERMNKRAIKINAPPITIEKGERVVLPVNGLNDRDGVYTAQTIGIVGATPVLDGWSFVATFELTPQGSIIRQAPTSTLTIPPEYRDAARPCDQCATSRDRNEMYLIHHADHGFKLVGSGCLADFLPHGNPHDYAKLAEDLGGLDQFIGACMDPHGEECVEMDDFLASVAYHARHYGYVTRALAERLGSYESVTSTRAWRAIMEWRRMDAHERGRHLRFLKREGKEHSPADHELGTKALAWARSLEAKPGESDFEHNLRIAAKQSVVTDRMAGLVASILPAYQRAADAAKPARTKSRHVGTIGERLDLTLHCEDVLVRFDQHDGRQFRIVTLLDAEGNVFKTFSDQKAGWVVGQTYEVRARVKAHDIYRDTQQTTLSHVKVKNAPKTKHPDARPDEEARMIELANRVRRAKDPNALEVVGYHKCQRCKGAVLTFSDGTQEHARPQDAETCHKLCPDAWRIA